MTGFYQLLDSARHAELKLGAIEEELTAIKVEREHDRKWIAVALDGLKNELKTDLTIDIRDDLRARLIAQSAVTEDLHRRTVRHSTQAELSLYDIKRMLMGGIKIEPVKIEFSAQRAVAFDSPDHIVPWGTMRDNTRHPRFVRRCEEIFERKVKHLDIGCAGGGLVWDFTVAGNLSVGVEGSDYSRRNIRAEWGTIPDRLFTADVCYPFDIKQNGESMQFDVISAWELFEHIQTDKVDDVISHLLAHLAPEGVLVCSIATFIDMDPETGTVFHQTVKPKGWWEERFAEQGLKPVAGLFEIGDFVRGAGHSGDDWDAKTNPHLGFHLVLRRE